MMAETTKIAGFGNDGQRDDGADAGELRRRCRRLAVPQQRLGLGFDLVALPDQAAASAMTSRNMRMAGESGGTGNAMDDRAVS